MGAARDALIVGPLNMECLKSTQQISASQVLSLYLIHTTLRCQGQKACVVYEGESLGWIVLWYEFWLSLCSTINRITEVQGIRSRIFVKFVVNNENSDLGAVGLIKILHVISFIPQSRTELNEAGVSNMRLAYMGSAKRPSSGPIKVYKLRYFANINKL